MGRRPPRARHRHLLEECRGRGILVQAYSPLTRGERLDDPTLVRIAGAHDRSPAQVLLRWHLQIGVVPIPKASSREHVAENAEVFDFELSNTEMGELAGLDDHWSTLSDRPIYA